MARWSATRSSAARTRRRDRSVTCPASPPIHYLLAQVHHLQVERRAPLALQHRAEGGLVLARRARGDDHALEPAIADPLREPRSTLAGAQDLVRRDVRGGRPGRRIVQLAEADQVPEVRAAAAEVDADPAGGRLGRPRGPPPPRLLVAHIGSSVSTGSG
jgi:hypothetical protein